MSFSLTLNSFNFISLNDVLSSFDIIKLNRDARNNDENHEKEMKQQEQKYKVFINIINNEFNVNQRI